MKPEGSVETDGERVEVGDVFHSRRARPVMEVTVRKVYRGGDGKMHAFVDRSTSRRKQSIRCDRLIQASLYEFIGGAG